MLAENDPTIDMIERKTTVVFDDIICIIVDRNKVKEVRNLDKDDYNTVLRLGVVDTLEKQARMTKKVHYTLFYNLRIDIYDIIRNWPAPPDDPQGIRVASGFEFSVCLSVCLFVCLSVCSLQIF